MATPKVLDAALLAKAFAHEIVFERPPQAVQRALAVTVVPIARRRGRLVTGDLMRTAIVTAECWPGPGDPDVVTSPQYVVSARARGAAGRQASSIPAAA